MKSNLFIDKISLNRDKINSFDEYPFNIEIIKDFNELNFTEPVTFFIGENGTGKSTFLEAIAIAMGLNAEGGTQNFNFVTKNTSSSLSNYLKISRHNYPENKFFLRAESFYNFSSEMQRLVEEDHYFKLYRSYGGNLHNCSHGESFIKLVKNRFGDNGLYILDEPEAALLSERQMTLLCLIDDLVKRESQFIIATHSPILISYYKGVILDLDNNFKITKYEDTKIYNLYRLYLDNPYGMQKRLFEGED